MAFTTVSTADTYGTGVPSHAADLGSRYTQTDAAKGTNIWICTTAGVALASSWTKVAGGADSSYAHSSFKSPTSGSGIYHGFGYYNAPAAAKAATQASATQTLGTANIAYGGRVFCVASGPGSASGGTTGTAKITVTGTSFNEITGVRTAGDSEILVADVTAAALNQYFQTTKNWIGQVVLTLATTGDRTLFAFTFNYGYAAMFDFNDNSVTITKFEATGRAGASDAGFNIQVLKHSPVGWTYSAAAFVAGGTVLWDMAAEYAPESQIASSQRFRFYRESLTQVINGAVGEGIVVRITTTQNNAVDTMDMRMFYTVN